MSFVSSYTCKQTGIIKIKNKTPASTRIEESWSLASLGISTFENKSRCVEEDEAPAF